MSLPIRTLRNLTERLDVLGGSLGRRAMSGLVILGLLGVALVPSSSSPIASAASPFTKSNPICSQLGHSIQASTGAQMFCNGPQANGPNSAQPARTLSSLVQRVRMP